MHDAHLTCDVASALVQSCIKHISRVVLPQLLHSPKDCTTSHTAMVVVQSVLPPILHVKEELIANRAGYVLGSQVEQKLISRVCGQPHRTCRSLCLHNTSIAHRAAEALCALANGENLALVKALIL